MSHVDDFDVLVVEQEQGKDRIATVIQTALHNVKHADTSERYAGQALRLRGAAVLLQTAAVDVAALMGSFELAAKVSESGMLDQDEADHRGARRFAVVRTRMRRIGC